MTGIDYTCTLHRENGEWQIELNIATWLIEDIMWDIESNKILPLIVMRRGMVDGHSYYPGYGSTAVARVKFEETAKEKDG